jgi:hypothetical protein
MVLTGAVEHTALPAATEVASFTDTNLTDAANGFTATIYWGDVTSSARVVAGSNGNFVVSGGHTYAHEMDGTASVSITRLADGLQNTISGPVTVSDNAAALLLAGMALACGDFAFRGRQAPRG